DIRMPHLREVAELPFEARHCVGDRALQDLQRDRAVAITVESLVDNAEGPRTQAREDLKAILHAARILPALPFDRKLMTVTVTIRLTKSRFAASVFLRC